MHDGSSESSKPVAGSPFTGSTLPAKILSSGSALYVLAKSDSSGDADGFVAEYKITFGDSLN